MTRLSWGSFPREALTSKRIRRYRLRRPSSSFGFDRLHRRVHAGSADRETSQGVSPPDLEVFSVSTRVPDGFVRSAGFFRVSSPSEFSTLSTPRCAIRGTSRRVRAPSTVPVRCGFTPAAMPGHRRLQGFVTLVAPSSPLRASRVCFTPVRPWGSPLQGFFLRRVARTSRFVLCPPGIFRSVSERHRTHALRALIPGGSSSPEACLFGRIGPLPSWGLPLQGLSRPISPLLAGASSSFSARQVLDACPAAAPRGHRPDGEERRFSRRSRPS